MANSTNASRVMFFQSSPKPSNSFSARVTVPYMLLEIPFT